MSTNLKSKAVSAIIVLTMLLLGCAFGYFALGKHQSRADAAVPTPSPQSCAFCGGASSGGSATTGTLSTSTVTNGTGAQTGTVR